MTMMNTAVSGMLAQNNWLATIAQNVANTSTTGYKDAETDFAAVVDSMTSSSTTPGLGVTTSSRTMAALQGGISGASEPTDLAVQGQGFFVVSNSAGDTFLTRDGSFVPDKNGDLVNSAGYYLMGLNLQNGPIAPGSISSPSQLQKVNVEQSQPMVMATTAGTLSFNFPSTASIVPASSAPAGGGTTTTDETSLVAYDSTGTPVTLNIYATKLADNAAGQPTWEIDVYNAANASAGGGFPYSAPALASQTINFDPTTGKATGATSLSVQVPNGSTMTLDLSSSTQLASTFAGTGNTNGNAPTPLTGVSVSAYGTLQFLYGNGTSISAYSIPLANVAGPDNLTSEDGQVFQTNANTGDIMLGEPGSKGLGTVKSSALENSTVDLPTQLTSMIQAQSDYGFNSQVFQTASTLEQSLKDL
jgi:flagellar hook protein FlgE